jgi:hypothetical protein
VTTVTAVPELSFASPDEAHAEIASEHITRLRSALLIVWPPIDRGPLILQSRYWLAGAPKAAFVTKLQSDQSATKSHVRGSRRLFGLGGYVPPRVGPRRGDEVRRTRGASADLSQPETLLSIDRNTPGMGERSMHAKFNINNNYLKK